MKTLLSIVAVSASLLLVSPAAASPTHREEVDGCDHGATGKKCLPDPSPSGRDCEKHGKHGGVNEDHCDATTEEAPSTTTTTIGTPNTATTTTITLATPGGSTPTVTDTPSSSTPTVPSNASTTSSSERPAIPQTDIASTTSHGMAEPPRTGAYTTWLVGIGLVCLFLGLALRGL